MYDKPQLDPDDASATAATAMLAYWCRFLKALLADLKLVWLLHDTSWANGVLLAIDWACGLVADEVYICLLLFVFI